MEPAGRQAVVLCVNQDAGISPDRPKGAAVHLMAMRQAFTGIGAACLGIDEPDDEQLTRSLEAALDRGPVDLIYERHALGKSAASHFASAHDIPLVLEVNAPLAEEQRHWRGGSNEKEDARQDRFSMQTADRIIAVSSDVARYARERGAEPKRVCVFPNAADVSRFRPSVRSESVRDALVPEGRFVIGFHGRLRPWHGFDMLLRVFLALLGNDRDVHLLVVGEGDFNALEKLPASRYTKVGWQAHEDIPRYVAAFDALPLTYHADLPCYFSPLKLTEAMGCGVVPLVPDLGDLPDVVTHLETGLVYAAGDEGQLREQLESLVRDRELLEDLGRRTALEASRHSWENIAEFALESIADFRRSGSESS